MCRLSIIILLMGGLLSACAAPSDPPTQSKESFRHLAAVEMLTSAYSQVADKYIEKVSVGDLALEGMRGLGSIDPSLTVVKTESNIRLVTAGQEAAVFNIPAQDNTTEWAALTVNIWKSSRQTSETLKNAGSEKIYEAIFDGFLSNLDVYSRYAGADQARRNRNRRDGFGGIGIRFRIRNNSVRILKVLPNTPAKRAGLRLGDTITHVGDVPLKDLKPRDVIAQLHGPIESIVVITVRRQGYAKPLMFEIERALIVPNNVTARLEADVAVIGIKSFNQKTTDRILSHVKAAKEKNPHLKGVILDLRGNPGGLLKQSIKTADLFLKQGNIISTRGRHPNSHQFYNAHSDDITEGLPIVILLDGKSASAAEVLAAALQDSNRAVVLGTKSFGKGTVQTVIRLPNDGEITLTWSRLYSPAGYVFHNRGIIPSVCTSGRTQVNQEFLKPVPSKENCLPERRKGKVDITLARKLLGDRMLYNQALNFRAKMADSPNKEVSHQPTAP